MLETDQIQVARLLFSTTKVCPMMHLELTQQQKKDSCFLYLHLNFVLVSGNGDIQYKAQL